MKREAENVIMQSNVLDQKYILYCTFKKCHSFSDIFILNFYDIFRNVL